MVINQAQQNTRLLDLIANERKEKKALQNELRVLRDTNAVMLGLIRRYHQAYGILPEDGAPVTNAMQKLEIMPPPPIPFLRHNKKEPVTANIKHCDHKGECACIPPPPEPFARFRKAA